MRKFLAIFVLSTFTLLSGGIVWAQEETAGQFTDLSDRNQYYPSIIDLYDRGIVQGYDDGTFRPYDTVNRVEALKIVLENYGWVENGATEETDLPEFSDIESEAWYMPYLTLAYENEIISGYPDGSFQPDNDVNLAEALKVISRAADFSFIERTTLEIDPAQDVPADAWYAGYAQYALDQGAIYLNENGDVAGDQPVTRGQLADIIYRFEYDNYYSGQVYYGNATFYADMFEGRTTACGEIFQQDLPTAAHLTLPFGTYLRVTQLNTGDTIEVRVNDRGPYSDHAIIDLSSSAFDYIGALGSGVIPVEIEIVYPEE